LVSVAYGFINCIEVLHKHTDTQRGLLQSWHNPTVPVGRRAELTASLCIVRPAKENRENKREGNSEREREREGEVENNPS